MRAKVNIADVAALRDAVLKQGANVNDIIERYNGAVNSARSAIQTEITSNNSAIADALKGKAATNDAIAKVRAKLNQLRAQLARTPPTITVTYDDGNGGTTTSVEPNPAYYALLDQISQLEGRIELLNSYLPRFEGIASLARSNISRCQSALHELDMLSHDLNSDNHLLMQLSEEGSSKLARIITVLGEFLAERIAYDFSSGGVYNSFNNGHVVSGPGPSPARGPVPSPVHVPGPNPAPGPIPSPNPIPGPVPSPGPVPVPGPGLLAAAFVDPHVFNLPSEQDLLQRHGPGYPYGQRSRIYDRVAREHDQTVTDRGAIIDFLSYDYGDFAQEIHANPASISAALQKKKKVIGDYVNQCPHDFCFYLYRGAESFEDLFGPDYQKRSVEELNQKGKGMLFTDGSFLSGSFEEDDILSYNVVALRVPWDCAALFVREIDPFDAGTHEIILPAGLLFRFRHIEQLSSGGHRLEADIIGRTHP